MAALFTGKALMANRERDEVETERELSLALENKVLLLYFGSGQCPRCRQFSPLLKEFFLRLTDEFYVERASQLVLVYVSRDETEEQQSAFLRTMPKRWLAVPFGDAFKRYLRGEGAKQTASSTRPSLPLQIFTLFPDVFPHIQPPWSGRGGVLTEKKKPQKIQIQAVWLRLFIKQKYFLFPRLAFS